MTLQQFYIGATGMDAFQKDLMNITNNVANAQTVGFKKSRLEYENLFPKILDQAVAVYEEDMVKPSVKIGTGVRVVSANKDFTQGSINVTGKPFDLAIEGDGFFQIRRLDGSIAYTRAGNFRKDSEGNIVDQNGNLLEPSINIPSSATSVSIDQSGKVFIQESNNETSTEIGQILIARFSNPSGLESIGRNLFVPTQDSGEPVVDVPGQGVMGSIAQGSLEYSNVDVVSEMMRMVITQRAFEIVSKLVQSGETMLKSATEIARA